MKQANGVSDRKSTGGTVCSNRTKSRTKWDIDLIQILFLLMTESFDTNEIVGSTIIVVLIMG